MSQVGASRKKQPWKPADATDAIRSLAHESAMTLDLTAHARDQLAKRDLIVGDVLHVLKHGFVHDNPEPATRANCFKYKMVATSPAGPRAVRVVVIPWVEPPELKIVTVMWRDEPMQ
jgi:hypothetical protein